MALQSEVDLLKDERQKIIQESSASVETQRQEIESHFMSLMAEKEKDFE